MKPTVHSCLENLLYEATAQFDRSKDLYEKVLLFMIRNTKYKSKMDVIITKQP